MYQWACQYNNKLLTALEAASKEREEFIEDPNPRTLSSIEKKILENDRADLQEHLAQLDRAGPTQLTICDLLDSYAYLVEKKRHWRVSTRRNTFTCSTRVYPV